jgi:hypothetical protein
MKRLALDDGLLCRLSAEALAGRQRFDRRIFIREQIDVYRQYGAFMRKANDVGPRARDETTREDITEGFDPSSAH